MSVVPGCAGLVTFGGRWAGDAQGHRGVGGTRMPARVSPPAAKRLSRGVATEELTMSGRRQPTRSVCCRAWRWTRMCVGNAKWAWKSAAGVQMCAQGNVWHCRHQDSACCPAQCLGSGHCASDAHFPRASGYVAEHKHTASIHLMLQPDLVSPSSAVCCTRLRNSLCWSNFRKHHEAVCPTGGRTHQLCKACKG